MILVKRGFLRGMPPQTPPFQAISKVAVLRRLIGLLCIAIGVAGCILPIVPGLPFLAVGARVLGRRDPALRRMLAGCHSSMRRLRRARAPLLRHAATRLTPHWRRLARLLVA
jgi:hypothetical protein